MATGGRARSANRFRAGCRSFVVEGRPAGAGARRSPLVRSRAPSGGALVRRLVLLVVVGSMLVAAPSAQARPASVFKGAVTCSTQPDGIRFCGSLVVDRRATPAR